MLSETKNPNNLSPEEQEMLRTLLRSINVRSSSLDKIKLGPGTIGSVEIADGSVIAAKLTKDSQTWTTDIVFTASDQDTVAWTSGTITFADGTSYSISSGNTGNMTVLTYIYFDKDVSSTVLQQSTTFSDAAGDNVILVCVAKKATDAAQTAFFIPAIGTFGINETVIGPNSISTGKIQALAITTGLLAANAVTAAKISVASLSAISADLGSITAGSITSVTITSSTISAGTITGTTIKTAGSGGRIELDSTNGLRAYNSGGSLITQINLSNGILVSNTITGATGSLGISDSPSLGATLTIATSFCAFVVTGPIICFTSSSSLFSVSGNFQCPSGNGLTNGSGVSVVVASGGIELYQSSTLRATFSAGTQFSVGGTLKTVNIDTQDFGSGTKSYVYLT